MIHHIAIHHNYIAIVRSADNGITDIEWEHGCRSIQLSYKRELDAQKYVQHLGYKLLNSQEWSEYINNLDEGIVPSNKFINTRYIKDKWDGARDVY